MGIGYAVVMPSDHDFRKLPSSTQAELRRVAVNMVLSGTNRIDVARAIGVNRRFVGEWVRAFEATGEAALAGGRRGRRPGEQKALNRRQEATIRRLIVGRCPDQLKLPFALWTREAVGQLIERKAGIRLSPTAIGTVSFGLESDPTKADPAGDGKERGGDPDMDETRIPGDRETSPKGKS